MPKIVTGARFWKRLIQLALVLYFSSALTLLVAAPDYPDRLTILSLLENRQFEELEDLLGSYQLRYERGEIDERLIAYSLETLSNSNPDYQTVLNDWVEQRGGSFVPYLVRAYYYYGVAWSWRGHRSESETASHRLANMENFLQLAAEDITQATQLNPRLSAADALALRVLMMLDGEEYKKETLKEALQINPDSYLVRASYIWGMKPGWGGKPEELMQFMKETESLVEEHPHLKTLLGYADYIFAESLTEKKRFEEAAVHFDFAVDKGADHIVYRERGINYYNLKKYDLALKDFDSALGLWPQNPKTLRWRSHALQRLKDNESALKDLDLALRLVPMDRYVLMAHAFLSRKMRIFEQVLGDYEKALFS